MITTTMMIRRIIIVIMIILIVQVIIMLLIVTNDNINSAGDNNVTDSNTRGNILPAVSILHFSLFAISIQHYIENKVLTVPMKCNSRI